MIQDLHSHTYYSFCGKDDPEVALIRVCPEKGEYWDSPNATMLHLYGTVKAALTGESPKTETKKVGLS